MRPFAICCSVTFVLLIASANGAIHTVRPDGSGDYPTIQAAIDAAFDEDIVELTDGTFTGDGNRDIDFLGKQIVVCSQNGDAASCVIDCEGTAHDPHRAFYFHSNENAEASIEYIHVINGHAASEWPDNCGGAVYCINASPSIRDCVFTNNTATYGGAVFLADSSTSEMSNCILSRNSAERAGGLYCYHLSSPSVFNCMFEENTGGICGAIQYNGSTPGVIAGCTFQNNDGGMFAGALLCRDSSPLVRHCVFAGNIAEHGAALTCDVDAAPTLSSCTLVMNEATYGSSVLSTWYSNPVLINCIIAFGIDGAAVYCSGEDSTPGLSCCDIFGNEGGDWTGCIADQNNINGNFSANPFFCDLEVGDFHLWNYSPCNQQGCGVIGAFPVGCWDVQGGDPGIAVRSRLSLGVTPNPVSGTARVTFALPAESQGTIELFDTGGRFVDAIPTTGTSGAVDWNRSDLFGNLVPAGVYHARLTTGRESVTRTLVVVR